MWAPLYAGFEPAKEWLSRVKPDLMIVLYNDHMNRFFFDAYPSFALGVADTYPQADEGWGRRDLPDLPGILRKAWWRMSSTPPYARRWPSTTASSPSSRCSQTHPGLRRSCPSPPMSFCILFRRRDVSFASARPFPAPSRVLVMATGAMSHQLHGPRFGFVNPQWDNEFLDRLESDPQSLISLTHADYMERGGAESVEMIMW